jgi:hypothetical protein
LDGVIAQGLKNKNGPQIRLHAQTEKRCSSVNGLETKILYKMMFKLRLHCRSTNIQVEKVFKQSSIDVWDLCIFAKRHAHSFGQGEDEAEIWHC